MEKNKKKFNENIDKEIFLSIITPCYNVEKYLSDYFKCLDDITHECVEFILIDDGSKDNTSKIIEQYLNSHKHKFISFYSQPNMGVGLTRTSLIKYAKGKYIISIDADDFIKFNSINVIFDILKKENPDALCLNFTKVKENTNYKKIYLNEIKYKTYLKKDLNILLKKILALNKISAGSANFIYKKSLVNKIKINDAYYKDIVGEDFDFELRFLLVCNKVLLSDSSYYFYRMRKTSLMHDSFNEKYITNLYFVNRMLEDDIDKEVKEYALARKCLSSIDVLQKMINSKYSNNFNIRFVYQVYSNNLKYIKMCSLLPWYVRYFTFLTKPYFYLRLRTNLK